SSWPPDFSGSPGPKRVVFQPWEYGSVPRDWVGPLNEADEVWVPTTWVRDAYVRGGVRAEHVHVVPYGVDAELFAPGRDPLPLPTRKRYRFLFVGGTIWRKGPDIALQAYLDGFRPHDDVALVVKDMGTDGIYRGQTMHEEILRV